MIDKNTTINAVSPLKRKKSYKGGTKVKKAATATAKRRGGFGRSTATSNKAGYNVQTRFKYMKGNAPASGGSTKEPTNTPSKPYHYDKNGNVVVNNYIDVAGGKDPKQKQEQTITTTTEDGTPGYWTYKDVTTTKKVGGKNRETYEEAWERKKGKYTTKGQKSRMGTDENEYNVFANIDEYIDYMEKVKEYNKTEEGKAWSKKNRKSSKERTISTTKRVKDEFIPGTPGSTKSTTSQRQSQG